MGVVYYANYFVWFEVGRTDLLRDAGWSYRQLERDGYILPVISAHCGYRQAAKYDDEIEIRTRCEMLSPVRLRFQYEVARVGDTTLLAEGNTTHASLGLEGRPRRLPDRIVDFLRARGRKGVQ